MDRRAERQGGLKKEVEAKGNERFDKVRRVLECVVSRKCTL